MKINFLTNKNGFTMMELLIAILVLVIALVGLLYAYIGCFSLNETARNLTVATNAAQQRMEEIRNTNFDSITSTFNGVTFSIPDATHPNDWLLSQNYIAKSFISTVVVNQLLKATVVVCWRQKSGRIIGQARDSGGNLILIDDSENAQSPCLLVTYIAKR